VEVQTRIQAEAQYAMSSPLPLPYDRSFSSLSHRSNNRTSGRWASQWLGGKNQSFSASVAALNRTMKEEAAEEDSLAVLPLILANTSSVPVLPLCRGTRHEGRWIRCDITETAMYSPKLVHDGTIRTKYSSASDQEQVSVDESFFIAAYRWQPYCCRYHHYTRSELHTCFRDKRIWIHYVGDSVSRDTFHDFPEFLWEAQRVKLHSNVFAAPTSNEYMFTFNWLGDALHHMLEKSTINFQTFAPWSTPEGMGTQYPEWDHSIWDWVNHTSVRRVPDVWVFNIGLWDNNPHDVFRWKEELILLARVIREIHIAYPQIRLFWRTITPLVFPAAQFREYNQAALRVFDDVGLDVEVWDAAIVADSQNHDHGEGVHFAGVTGRTYSNILANVLCNK
jgi:hypothetical protein